ncbi:hypothetical protein LQW54_006975 [Pestalotiopsis sp. IQ-011]
MPDLDAATVRSPDPRETEWTKTGQYTGLTDLSLTSAGLAQVAGTAAQLVGPQKLIGPGAGRARLAVSEKTVATEDIAEWHYGDYEGLRTAEIKASRAERGLDTERAWDVWRDGCEGGEYIFCCPGSVSLDIMLTECDRSADQVSARLDELISEIRNVQRPGFNGEGPCDVVLAAHGHILRAFAQRWIRCPLETPLPIMMSPGAIAVLR